MPRAEQDIEDIWQYIATESTMAADRVLERIETAFQGSATTADFARPERIPRCSEYPESRFFTRRAVRAMSDLVTPGSFPVQ